MIYIEMLFCDLVTNNCRRLAVISSCYIWIQMEEKIKEVVEIKQRNLAEENQKTMELLKDR